MRNRQVYHDKKSIVLRYLIGATLSDEDTDLAWDAMHAFDMRREENRR